MAHFAALGTRYCTHFDRKLLSAFCAILASRDALFDMSVNRQFIQAGPLGPASQWALCRIATGNLGRLRAAGGIGCVRKRL